ncbi:SurA N-terminal domain-containing protein [Urechidicola croceus]|uniref:Periplasmic chaperone PpiD n=1 Tax=Urechidicola croceus TaxID=1850246 RepID=A0A1D8P779_9FLAO|nr:SurA N-terminal domain-containing protein [Urechidicola croceus]AOW20413.1 hypothetical protein LPB138_06875 [Urechidicola croceus]
MAILSKIRERSVFLILIIGLALLAFVLDPSSIQSFFQSSKLNSIGEVNGESISREDFANEMENYKARTQGRATNQDAMNYVWDKMVGDQIYKDQLEKSGVVVGEEDVWNTIISMPYFQNDPTFKNAAGLFDEEKVKEYIASLKDNAEGAAKGSQEMNTWQNWLRNEASIRQNIEKTAFNNLVSAGLGASLKEGERDYSFNNAKVTSKYVYIPYTSIADSLITLTNSEYQTYINENAKEFEVDESRDISYVKFDIVASEEDKQAIKNDIAKYIEDHEEYNKVSKSTEKIVGLKNTQNISEFLEIAKSDLAIDDTYKFKNRLPKAISQDILNGKKGDVYGPYEENGYYKISKITGVAQLPDSVKASYITVAYQGALRSTSVKTKEQAKKSADSIFRLVKNSSKRFAEIADQVNLDGSRGKGGELGWVTKDAAYGQGFDRDFAEFLFENKKGSIDVVETQFGYQIIKVEDQKNVQTAIQLTSLAREITPSIDTENKFYLDAETFASELSKGQDISTLAKEKSYRVLPAVGLKVLDEKVPGLLNNQRQIVNWTFENETEVKDVKRFEIESGYVVAVLNAKTPKGLAPVASVINKVRPILLKRKKAKLIADKMNGSSIDEIAQNNATSVKTASSITLLSPTISGVGSEPAIVGAMMGAPEGKLINNLEGNKGVFAIQVDKVEAAPEMPNYESNRNRIASKVKGRSGQIFNSLKSSYEIEDYRSSMY